MLRLRHQAKPRCARRDQVGRERSRSEERPTSQVSGAAVTFLWKLTTIFFIDLSRFWCLSEGTLPSSPLCIKCDRDQSLASPTCCRLVEKSTCPPSRKQLKAATQHRTEFSPSFAALHSPTNAPSARVMDCIRSTDSVLRKSRCAACNRDGKFSHFPSSGLVFAMQVYPKHT